MRKKDFRVAEIVSVNQLEDTKDNQYHMCLAHLVGKDGRYDAFFKKMSDEGKYVLMDNGAAEGSQLGFESLVSKYEVISPTEIVVPDTLCNSLDTVAKAGRFFARYGDLPYRKMVVPQGKTVQEWVDCAQQLVWQYKDKINTIGISKFLPMVTEDPQARYEAMSALEDILTASHCDHIEVHLLGCDEGPTMMARIQRGFDRVRGCDSAFAYIAAQGGVELTAESLRPEGQIDFLKGKYLDNYLRTAQAFETYAGVTGDNGVSETWRA